MKMGASPKHKNSGFQRGSWVETKFPPQSLDLPCKQNCQWWQDAAHFKWMQWYNNIHTYFRYMSLHHHTEYIHIHTHVCMLSHFSHVRSGHSLWPYGLPGSSVHGILQVRILEWVAMLSSRGSSWPRNQTRVSCIAGRVFTSWTSREAL